ncbi:hypothetical protein [Arthrobacter castelli]|uniref:hypothetical protein n=1 Tax=Arthrobacter castelli TaxID=271431 RepID=UPI0003F695EB|nr:hypothetical protein [Arthrobacter castelli]
MGTVSFRTVGRVALLSLPALVAFSIPLLGFVASLILVPLAAYRVRPTLWPRTSRLAAASWSALALAGLWFPALLALLSQGAVLLGGSVVWLLIPLCTPVGLTAVMVPAAAATAVGLAGAMASLRTPRPWPWVVGLWVSPFAYIAASLWLVDASFHC